jgi:hypothetical protein
LDLEGRLFGFLLKFGFFSVVKVVDSFLDLINFVGQFISCCAIFLVFLWDFLFLDYFVFSEIFLADFVDTWLLMRFLLGVLQLKLVISFCLLS